MAPSLLNAGATEYVPLSLEAEKRPELTPPQVEEQLPPIERVPRDVSRESRCLSFEFEFSFSSFRKKERVSSKQFPPVIPRRLATPFSPSFLRLLAVRMSS